MVYPQVASYMGDLTVAVAKEKKEKIAATIHPFVLPTQRGIAKKKGKKKKKALGRINQREEKWHRDWRSDARLWNLCKPTPMKQKIEKRKRNVENSSGKVLWPHTLGEANHRQGGVGYVVTTQRENSLQIYYKPFKVHLMFVTWVKQQTLGGGWWAPPTSAFLH